MNNKVLKNPILRKTVFAALLAALVCAATMVITIPSPLGGFLNLGDGFVLLSGWLLGPLYGFAAGGIGSALADLFLGYPVYIPGTFVIKGLSALLASVLCAAFCRKVQSVESVSADDYLASIGADNATRAELKTVWESWED